MAEAAVSAVRGRPPSVGGFRHLGGRLLARLHGHADGFLGSTERIDPELDKYKERGEEAGRRAARWWAEASQHLNGECASLGSRIKESDEEETRLTKEIQDLRGRFADSASKSHDEGRLRDLEGRLEFARREQRDLRDRLERAKAQREAAYRMARTSAEQFKDYYEGLIHTYLAANRKAPRRDFPTAEIELPSSLKAERFADDRAEMPAPPAEAPPAPAGGSAADAPPA